MVEFDRAYLEKKRQVINYNLPRTDILNIHAELSVSRIISNHLRLY